jgi:hypothetical protein
MAMIAYGASRFALAYGDRQTAEELLPSIMRCLEYCRRKVNAQGVVASDSDELGKNTPQEPARCERRLTAISARRRSKGMPCVCI